MFKEAFAGMHSSIGAAPSPGGCAASAVQLEAQDHAAMTGLADFSSAITQTPDAVNPMRPAEQDNFAYQVSRETSVGGRSQADRWFSQQQKFQLRASYHTPSVPGTELRLGRSAESQNYNYHEIDDDEKRRDERLQLLASLSGQVLLQAYPNAHLGK
ncbi:hypothetical protein [Massilia sp. TWR1-2-2]|uniref:hypothetical protein n=1 Tax=Massilia sp. TWR1-2-2 TaxID=2804584 RepID=UPI003CF82898